MPINLTVSGKAGIAEALASVVYNGLTQLTLFPDTKKIQITKSDGTIMDIDIAGNTTATITCSSASTTYTMVIAGT